MNVVLYHFNRIIERGNFKIIDLENRGKDFEWQIVERLSKPIYNDDSQILNFTSTRTNTPHKTHTNYNITIENFNIVDRDDMSHFINYEDKINTRIDNDVKKYTKTKNVLKALSTIIKMIEGEVLTSNENSIKEDIKNVYLSVKEKQKQIRDKKTNLKL